MPLLLSEWNTKNLNECDTQLGRKNNQNFTKYMNKKMMKPTLSH